MAFSCTQVMPLTEGGISSKVRDAARRPLLRGDDPYSAAAPVRPASRMNSRRVGATGARRWYGLNISPRRRRDKGCKFCMLAFNRMPRVHGSTHSCHTGLAFVLAIGMVVAVLASPPAAG